MCPPSSLDPERLDVIWGRTPVRARGPKPSLTVEQVAQAAIALADDAGLDAVSMKRLAEVLKVGTMTLYTYVPDKATLLHLMLDRALAEVTLPDASADWREHLRTSAEALLELYQGHPWIMQINVEGPPVTPHQMRYLESVLTALRKTGLNHGESLDIALSISYFVLGAAKLTVGILRAEQESTLSDDETHTRRAEALGRVLDPAEFPMVLQAMTAPPPEPPPVDIWASLGFRFGLDRLIDGIGTYIETRAPAPAGHEDGHEDDGPPTQ
ncbi:transcriptional regulator, TetR family [Xylanimonas cellulosilytica DSM 15894]|uniref:Transcriptional regulator, TetR family n=1 Tax=Xylanimonas cellulosilytica (strain DSM 15894 / JCM 12276 / CECT 5975 / KCTC 9989 / LMG 20990 / NBRC 107835 / XIL07) TaxID=446471 RepID=D1BUS7_XYLCX|nr:TetR/AcrR family transcriptional regulator C-terminal domain-containing protein [Xylanimonas cellulosilytica]ACZ29318.1 transcriptional regulator, TetR family [Xylanimonas cellulosilytica DSM 15894]